MDSVVRRIQAEDGEVLRRVRLAALLDTPSAFASTHESESDRPDEEWSLRAELAASGTTQATFFALLDGEVAGLVSCINHGDDSAEVELVSMWVAPLARRQGLARALVQAVSRWARGLGAEAVNLWVVEDNDSATWLYEALGFRPDGRSQILPAGSNTREIRMVLDTVLPLSGSTI